MKGYIPVEIPTKLYIKGYIIARLGEKPLMNREHMIGSKLCDLLLHRSNEDKMRFSSLYNCKLRIYLSMHQFRHRGHHLNETNLKNFNSFVEDIIKERFYFLMDFYMSIFPNFEANLPAVRKDLGIDDDHWMDDSMKKDYYRYRKRTNKPLLYNKTYPANVPPMPLANFAF